MPGITFVTALALSLLGAEPLWPDLSKQPPVTGGGEKDAAVVVAVEDYVFLPDVAGAVDTGTAWYLYLTKARKVPLVVLLRDGEATANKIRDAVEKATKRVKPGGRLWFVFIGHGAPSKDGKDGQLVGATAQADEMDFYPHTVGRSEILGLAGAAVAGSLAPVLVLDACFSGTDVAGGLLIKGAQFVVSEDLLAVAGQTATILTAGRAKDIAGQLPGASRPAFSYLVLGALRGWGDANGDGTVTAQEAVQYASDALVALEPGRMQEPQASGIDQPLTAKLTGSALEQGPDLADMKLKLAGGGSGGGGGENAAYRAEMEALKRQREKAKREAEEAARLEQAAMAKHSAQVEEAWKLTLEVAKEGGPEGKKAVELFLKRYQGHPLGNPKEAEAREMLEKLGATTGAAMKGYILVKPGCFQMGSPSGEEGRDGDETQHEVCITKAFYLKETEVTQREWREVMGNNPSSFSSCGDTCPVENVSWWDAVAYANALSKKEGLEACYTLSGCSGTMGKDYSCSSITFQGLGCKGYRLPTEAEWEYAARGGSREARYGNLDDVAWYDGNSGGKTHPVRQKKANAWGFYDMLGNVWEWCWDWYGNYDSTRNDPLGSSTGSSRVNRGGSWFNNAGDVRTANRDRYEPGYRDRYLGFRLSRSQ